MTQEHLTESGHLFHEDVFRALDAYEEAYPSQSGVQDTFTALAMRCLTFEPLANPSLHPERWCIARPHLDLLVTLSGGSLQFTACPWPERTRGHEAADFGSFPAAGGVPELSLLTLNIEDLRFELRDHGMSLPESGLARRRLVFACYEFVVRRLAIHFKVRVKRGLFCFGAGARLLIRDTRIPDDLLEAFDANTDPTALDWHPVFVELCKTAAIRPGMMVAYFKKYIQGIEEPQLTRTFSEFLGNFARYKQDPYAPELLKVLRVIADHEHFPPLVGSPSNALESFLSRRFAGDAIHDPVSSLAADYCLDRKTVFEILVKHHMAHLVTGVIQFPDIRRLLEMPALASHPEQAGGLQSKALIALKGIWERLMSKQLHVKLRQLATQAGFRSSDELHSWAQTHSPIVADWLISLHPAVRATKNRRKHLIPPRAEKSDA